jgi:hypothetical protein
MGHEVEIELPFRKDGITVFFLHRVIGSNAFGTSAIDTEGFTKGEMDVEADAVLCIVTHYPARDGLFPGIRVRDVLPDRYGRIAGISGYGSIVFYIERCVHQDGAKVK